MSSGSIERDGPKGSAGRWPVSSAAGRDLAALLAVLVVFWVVTGCLFENERARLLDAAGRGEANPAYAVMDTAQTMPVRRDGDPLGGWRADRRTALLFAASLTGLALFAWMRVGRLRHDASITNRSLDIVLRAQAASGAANRDAGEAAIARDAADARLGRDIRTSLNGILGGLDLLLDTRLDTEQAEYEGAARHAAFGLQRAVDATSLHGAGSPATLAVPTSDALCFDPALEAAVADAVVLGTPAPVRVLVVDDNAVNRMVAMHMLERQGHAVRTAEDGLQAVDAVREGCCDLVLMDLMMPGMNGLAATRAIRRLAGPGRDCAIVGLTANAGGADRASCEVAGMDGFLAEPVTRPKLEAAVVLASLLRRSGLESAVVPNDGSQAANIWARTAEM